MILCSCYLVQNVGLAELNEPVSSDISVLLKAQSVYSVRLFLFHTEADGRATRNLGRLKKNSLTLGSDCRAFC